MPGLALDPVDRLRPIEGQGRVVVTVPEACARVSQHRAVLVGIDDRHLGEPPRPDVVAAPPEVVVRVPVDVRGEHGDGRGRLAGSDDEREREEGVVADRLEVDVVEPGPFRGRDERPVVRREAPPMVIPATPPTREVPVREDLAVATGCERLEAPEVADLAPLPAVVPERGRVRLRASGPEAPRGLQHAPTWARRIREGGRREGGTDGAAHPGRCRPRRSCGHSPAARARPPAPGGHVRADLAARGRAHLDELVAATQLDTHSLEGDVHLVADVPDEHAHASPSPSRLRRRHPPVRR